MKIILTLLAISTMAMLAFCQTNNPVPTEPPPIQYIFIYPDDMQLQKVENDLGYTNDIPHRNIVPTGEQKMAVAIDLNFTNAAPARIVNLRITVRKMLVLRWQ